MAQAQSGRRILPDSAAAADRERARAPARAPGPGDLLCTSVGVRSRAPGSARSRMASSFDALLQFEEYLWQDRPPARSVPFSDADRSAVETARPRGHSKSQHRGAQELTDGAKTENSPHNDLAVAGWRRRSECSIDRSAHGGRLRGASSGRAGNSSQPV